MRGSAARSDKQIADDLTSWSWPPAPATFRLYEKYTDSESAFVSGERTWVLPARGGIQNVHFAADPEERRVQQAIVVHTQRDASPSQVATFASKLTVNWELCKRMLLSDPGKIRRFWDLEVLDAGRANMCKTVLKLACSCSVGPWSARQEGVVQGLATRSEQSSTIQALRIKKRDRLVSLDDQAEVTRVLDEANAHDLRETHAEGLTALALMYQHAMRPVQLLSLRTEHLTFTKDASGELVCVISFHSAKQRGSPVFEIPRQVKHEWVHIIECLYSHAVAAGRTRLFCVTTSGELKTRIRRVMLIFTGAEFDFNALTLRHTGAQRLADAGHDRQSIRNFLGHKTSTAAGAYVRASLEQGEFVNRAIGASKLYKKILSLADREFVSVDDMLAASDDQQIGAVVGDRLVAGIGLCRSSQTHCPYNPVTSCYGCSKFIPSSSVEAHQEAVGGMRAQVLAFLKTDPSGTSPAALQLTQALAGAQQALAALTGQEDGES